MLNIKFSTLFTILFLLVSSIYYPSTANAVMNEGSNYLNLESIKENELIPILSATPSNEAENNVKILFTKTQEGTKAFRFSISNLLLDFGILTPTNPIIRDNILNIYNSSSDYFSILASVNQPLTNSGSVFIPDTSCDNGACTQNLASVWENTLTFGFGFSCENIQFNVCLRDFQNGSYYKQFANRGDKELPVNIITGLNSDDEIESKLLYKVNVSTTQPQLSYSNNINFILVPGY